jgi:RNA polymerase sigma-70 factor (ECF subfamily)
MNLAIDALRKIQASRAVEMEDASEMPADQAPPSDPVEGEERMRLVREVVSKLPPRFRTVLVLRDLEGLSCREIVPIMRISHATVRWRLHRRDRCSVSTGCASRAAGVENRR